MQALIEPRLINENIELKVLEQDRILLNVQKMAAAASHFEYIEQQH